MTKRRAEKLTGYEIRQLSAGGIPVTAGAFRAGELVASAKNRTERLAMRDLVARVYRLHCYAVLEQWGGRCSRCGMRRRLPIDQRGHRTHGGTREAANPEAVCWDYHRMIQTSQ